MSFHTTKTVRTSQSWDTKRGYDFERALGGLKARRLYGMRGASIAKSVVYQGSLTQGVTITRHCFSYLEHLRRYDRISFKALKEEETLTVVKLLHNANLRYPLAFIALLMIVIPLALYTPDLQNIIYDDIRSMYVNRALYCTFYYTSSRVLGIACRN
ncbi:hypothetical protein J6590_020037 [Homalodisca vitripennis]|nr:hypothetical protein J6590_020037 [Homalodisca vitripennis]